ncbi:DHH family phosphohydrolase-like protein [Cotonvirus japonicus]|uniref:DHH family phosphohydrolase-like protein n=1 Tax=Cotonvirus japonicus TaxID=2811091 RepID=A0ABM7NT44_9VIRU|nr:DHH family phosphohydrolase-like protein [Cotonvirus japonicus]BCS83323.1 DHH family phosphohydrolase-like protein [Cotonvirus japonicus]
MEFILQEINDQYKIVGYTNENLSLDSQTFDDLLIKNQIADVICHREVINNNDNTYVKFHFKSKTKIIYNDTSIISMENGLFTTTNNTNYLSFNIINDYDLISIINDKIDIEYIILSKIQEKCTIIKILEIHEEWFEEKFLSTIKNKFSDSTFIVFESPSDFIDYCKEDSIIIPYKTYTMIFNDKTIKDPKQRLKYAVFSLDKGVLSFESHKEFSDIFSEEINKEKNQCELENSDEDNGDNYDEHDEHYHDGSDHGCEDIVEV